MNCHPQTPQSPSQLCTGNDSFQSLQSGHALETLPTPAHSVNGGNSQIEITMDDSQNHKRKRSADDSGDQSSKRIQTEAGAVGIEALHENVGPKYLLCKKPANHPKYPATEDYFMAFNLTGLAKKLARENEDGSKNILRKSFKNQLKDLKIEGGYDPKKDERKMPKDPNERMDEETFHFMLSMPEDYWYANYVKGKDYLDGFSTQTKMVIPKAAVMARGKIRKEAWDPYVIGSLDAASFLGDSSASDSATHTPGSGISRVPRAPGVNGGAGGLAGQVNDRAKRNVVKRSYNESSFEGYSESGFDDSTGGDSTGDDCNGIKHLKKNAGNMV